MEIGLKNKGRHRHFGYTQIVTGPLNMEEVRN